MVVSIKIAKTKPKKILPTSPIKIFAGEKFQNKNPLITATKSAKYRASTISFSLINKKVITVPTKIISKLTKPSIPSIKLTVLMAKKRIATDNKPLK